MLAIELVVGRLVQVHAALAVMSYEDRLLAGEKLAAALRKSGVLERYSVETSSHRQACEIDTDPLKVEIDATPMGISLEDLELSDADIPY